MLILNNFYIFRRLAKSILILIPIFGLHFIFFAWLPYATLVHLELGPCFEIIATYIETFFNAFQVIEYKLISNTVEALDFKI